MKQYLQHVILHASKGMTEKHSPLSQVQNRKDVSEAKVNGFHGEWVERVGTERVAAGMNQEHTSLPTSLGSSLLEPGTVHICKISTKFQSTTCQKEGPKGNAGQHEKAGCATNEQ